VEDEREMTYQKYLFAIVFSLLIIVQNVSANVIVRFEPDSQNVLVREYVDVNVVADISDPVLGWGLDLSYDLSKLSLQGQPAIGPLWQPVNAPDGDGLAGLVFPGSISGDGVLLATLRFWTKVEGLAALDMSVTPGDLNEGFPLDPTGFAQVSFQTGCINIIPEPAMSALLLTGVGFMRQRRKF